MTDTSDEKPTEDANETEAPAPDSVGSEADDEPTVTLGKKTSSKKVAQEEDDDEYEEVVVRRVRRRPEPEPVDDVDETTEIRPRRRPAASGSRRPVGDRLAPRAQAYARSGPSTLVTVGATVLVIALVAFAVVSAFFWWKKSSDLSDLQGQLADDAKAEQVASDYAVGAATFDYHDLTPWVNALTNGVSPDLKTKLNATSSAMNQLLQPLQWVSKASKLDAVVNSRSGGIYKVNVYVRVDATNVQTPTGRTVNVVYNVTLNKDAGWQITDVGSPAGLADNMGASQGGSSIPTTSAAPTTDQTAPTAGQTGAPAPVPGG